METKGKEMVNTKTVEFLVEGNQHYISDIPYKIVESNYPAYPLIPYDIYQVQTDDFTKIRVVWENGTEYMPDQLKKCKDGVYFVTVWTPIQ